MFGLFSARAAPRLGCVAASARIGSMLAPSLNRNTTVLLSSTLLSHRTRLFMTSASVSFPDEKTPGTKKTPAAKKTPAGDKTPAPKKTKPALKKKKKAAPKKKKVAAKKKPKKKKKVVKPKPIKITPDMKPPSAPGNAYIIWSSERRQSMPHPDTVAASVAVLKALGPQWSAMSDSEKQPYVDQYQENRKVYLQARAEWEANVPIGVFQALNKRRVAKGIQKIRRHHSTKPMTSFSRYLKEHMQSNTGPTRQRFSECAASWRAMGPTEKQVYTDAYLADKKVYDEAKAAAEPPSSQ